MGFIEMTILCYKALLAIVVVLVGIASFVAPVVYAAEEEKPYAFLFLLLAPVIISACVKIICLL